MALHLCCLLGVAAGWGLLLMLWEFRDSNWDRWVPFTDLPPQCFAISLRRRPMTILHPLFILGIWQEKMEEGGYQRVKLVLPSSTYHFQVKHFRLSKLIFPWSEEGLLGKHSQYLSVAFEGSVGLYFKINAFTWSSNFIGMFVVCNGH